MSVPDLGERGNGMRRSARISRPLFGTEPRRSSGGGIRPQRRLVPRDVPTFNTLITAPWEAAEEYRRMGLAVVPLLHRKKQAAIQWKAYQAVAPTPGEVDAWWGERPDAGMAVVLGPVSGVLVVDVDGPEAHAELVRRLGGEPVAPKVLTGSGGPHRYHLFFRHPAGVATRAKITPWHPQLEFRGRGGLSVLPPSVHPSGRRYRWACGRSLEELELPGLPPLILSALLADADGRGDRTGADRGAASVGRERLTEVQTRALALITKQLTAVQGAGGDKTTYTAACYLVKDFALSIEQALPVLETWNRTNCRPAWSVNELVHKLRKAAESIGPRGRLLDAAPAPADPAAMAPAPIVRKVGTATSAAFHAAVPDWVEYIWEVAKPRAPGVRNGRPRIVTGIKHLLVANVVLQKSPVVDLPDVALAQLVWGGDGARWPKRWRRKLADRLKRLASTNWFKATQEKTNCQGDCPAGCTRHRHLRFRLVHEAALDRFLPFATGITAEEGFTYDFAARRSHHPKPEVAEAKTKEIREFVRCGQWCAIYLPAWVFGPRVLPPGPCRILQAATRELTRARCRKSQRPDHAELVPGTDHPLLDDTKVYVGFNGNGSRKRPQFHGRGYALRTWMGRAGYPHDHNARSFRACAQEFFADLKCLTETLGVVAAVRVPGRDGWLTADEAMDEAEVVAPYRLTRRCVIQLYAPADYPDVWRAYFASKLDLGVIPKGEPGEIEVGDLGSAIATSEHLARWMKSVGLSDSELAAELGVCRSLVSRCRTGSRPPSRGFLEKLARFVAAQPIDAEPGVTKLSRK